MLSQELTIRMIEITCKLKDNLEIEKKQALLEEKLHKYYPTCTKISELKSLLFTSLDKKERLIIDTKNIHFIVSDIDELKNELYDNIHNQWACITSILSSENKCLVNINGLFTYKGKDNLDLKKILKWKRNSAKILGNGEIRVGAMLSVEDDSGMTLISLSGSENKKEQIEIQFYKTIETRLENFCIIIKDYFDGIDTKLSKVLEENFG